MKNVPNQDVMLRAPLGMACDALPLSPFFSGLLHLSVVKQRNRQRLASQRRWGWGVPAVDFSLHSRHPKTPSNLKVEVLGPVLVDSVSAVAIVSRVLLDGRGRPTAEGREVREGRVVVIVSIPKRVVRATSVRVAHDGSPLSFGQP